MRRTVDVAVIGGGPAGATTARLLAARGLEVVLFEKEHLPRYKPCGGGLTHKLLPRLPASALATAREHISRAEAWSGKHCVSAASRDTAVALVLRADFDHALCNAAVAAGARLLEGRLARITEAGPDGCRIDAGGDEWRSRYAVLACGTLGSSRLGLPLPRWAPALEAELDAGAEADRHRGLLVGDFGIVSGGYAWIFPKDGILSVGVCTWDRAAAGTLRRALDTFVAQRGLDTLPVLRLQGHPIPVGGTLAPGLLAQGPVLRVGDAAGLADPLIGEGIHYAVASAHLAADALAAGRPETYPAAVSAEILPQFRRLARAARIFYPRTATVVRMARWAPPLADSLLAWVV